MSHDVAVDSRLHAALRARDVLAEIERERVESIALALADAEQAAVERLDELRTIRRAHQLLTLERDVLREERDAARAEVAALRDVGADADRAQRAAAAELRTAQERAIARKARGAP